MKLQLYALICLCLSVSSADAGLFNKNKNADQQRRRLSQSSGSDVDADAATGTVKPVLTEEERMIKDAANTCDSQMAQSLVKANESMLQAKTERDAAVTAKEEAVNKNEQCETSVLKLNKEIEDLNQMLKAGRTPVEREFVTKIEDLKKNHESEIAKLQDELAKVRAEADARVAAKEQQIQDEAVKAEQLLATTKEEAKKYMITQVNAIKEEMTKLQSTHEEREQLSASKIRELDDTVQKHDEKHKQFEKMSSELKQEVEEWRNNFAKRSYINFTDMYVDFVDFTETTATKAKEAATKVGEQVAASSKKGYEQAAAASKTGYEKASIHAKDAHVKATKAYEEGKVKATKLYDEQYAIYWPKVEPHYNEHVLPLLKKKDEVVKDVLAWKSKEMDPHIANFQKQLDPHIKTVQTKYNTQFEKVTKLYGKQCKEALKASKEMDLPDIAEQAIPYMQQSCDDPATSVKYIQYFLIFLILYPFRRIILAPVWYVWGIVWWTLLTFTPLGFFFSKKKKKSTKTAKPKSSLNRTNGSSKTTNGVRIKQKVKKVNAQ